MSDGDEKRRPNANYRLSKESDNPDRITYHYDRERRLERAPDAVRNLYVQTPPRRFGLFRSLVDSKPRLMMFASIVITCIMLTLVSFLGVGSDSRNFDGNRLTIQAIDFEGTIIVALKKAVRKDLIARFGDHYTGAVSIAVSPAMKPGDEEMPEDIFYHRIFFSAAPQEVYRFALPFHADELLFVFQSENATLSARVKPE